VKPRPKPEALDPETELTFAPIEFDTTTFRVHFYWNGWDKDGEVVRFYFATDADTALPITQWHTTTAKDTTLKFLVDPIEKVRKHVFMISALDNSSRYDKTPARRTFSARTDPPTSQIDRGPAAFNPVVGPNFTFEWSGIDPDGSETGGRAPVDSFEYVLLLLGSVGEAGDDALPPYDQTYYTNLINAATGTELPSDFVFPPGTPPRDYSGWKWIGISELRHRFRNASPGEYVFAERAVDIAGATEEVLDFAVNIRHFTVSTRNPGPILCVTSSVLTLPLPCTSGPDDSPRKPLQIFEGETISFSWTANADAYGGEVVGYTHALDDTSSLPGLNLLDTGVTYTADKLPPGNHFLYVRAVDDGGLVTNAVIPILIVHPSFKDPGAPREILYVDDAQSPGAVPNRIGSFPSDAEETDWWTLDLLPNLGVPITEWDTFLAGQGDVEGRKQPEPRDMARYTTIVWNVDFNNGFASPTGLFKTLVGGAYSELAGYIRAGGTVILTGFSIANNTCEPRTVLYSNLSRGICFSIQTDDPAYRTSYFPRIYMGVDGAVANGEGLRSLGARDFISGYPTAAGIAAGYDTVQLDRGPLGSGAKWLTYPGSGDPNTNNAPGLPQVDGWNMAQNFGCQVQAALVFQPENATAPISLPIYRYHGANVGVTEQGGPSPREGMIVGVQVQSHSLGTSGATVYDPTSSLGRMVVLGFPLYFLRDQDALRVLQTAFNYVNASPTLP
jgi:hypothetical protein